MAKNIPVFCRRCGNRLTDDEKFCTKCGALLSLEKTNEAEPEQFSEKNEEKSKSEEEYTSKEEYDLDEEIKLTGESWSEDNGIFIKIKKNLLLLILAVCFLGAFLFFAIFFENNRNSSTENLNGIPFRESETGKIVGEKEEKGLEESPPVMLDNEFAKKIAEINSEGSSHSIDVYASAYTPNPRDYSAGWNNSLFYTLEDVNADSYSDGKINGYSITRKLLKNEETGNQMEYEVYTNPDTGIVNKIVSIEYKEGGLEIIDYYYDDAGKINFMFIRNDMNYVPSYATPSKDGYRYYFNNDSMVKWRFVDHGEVLNYVIGEQAAKENTLGNVLLYREMEPDLQFVYDEIEKRMINWAYNTYNVVRNTKSFSEITGYVYNEEGEPLHTAVITLYDEDGAIYQTSAEDKGLYNILVPSEEKEYRLVISEENFLPVTIYGIKINGQTLSEYQDSVYLVKKERRNQLSQVQILLYDAMNYAEDGTGMAPLGNAEIHVRSGLRCRDGATVADGIADASGFLKTELPPGMYTAEVEKEGYETSYCTFSVRADEELVRMNASPKLSAGDLRIVLTWGENPSDLDSHLFTPYDSTFGTSTYHIWFGSATDEMGDNLDVDDTTGYGPETMTIPAVKDGLYKYYVADFTNCAGNNSASYEMSLSGAVVSVYTSDGLAAEFRVPTNLPGAIWEVFEIRNGVISPIQRYYSNIDDKTWWCNEK